MTGPEGVLAVGLHVLLYLHHCSECSVGGDVARLQLPVPHGLRQVCEGYMVGMVNGQHQSVGRPRESLGVLYGIYLRASCIEESPVYLGKGIPVFLRYVPVVPPAVYGVLAHRSAVLSEHSVESLEVVALLILGLLLLYFIVLIFLFAPSLPLQTVELVVGEMFILFPHKRGLVVRKCLSLSTGEVHVVVHAGDHLALLVVSQHPVGHGIDESLSSCSVSRGYGLGEGIVHVLKDLLPLPLVNHSLYVPEKYLLLRTRILGEGLPRPILGHSCGYLVYGLLVECIHLVHPDTVVLPF